MTNLPKCSPKPVKSLEDDCIAISWQRSAAPSCHTARPLFQYGGGETVGNLEKLANALTLAITLVTY